MMIVDQDEVEADFKQFQGAVLASPWPEEIR